MATAGKTEVAGEVLAPEQSTGKVLTVEQLSDLVLVLAGQVGAAKTEQQKSEARALVDAYLSDCVATYQALRLTAQSDYDKRTNPALVKYEAATRPAREAYEAACKPHRAAYDKACEAFSHLLDGPKEALGYGQALVSMLDKRAGYEDLTKPQGTKGRVAKAGK